MTLVWRRNEQPHNCVNDFARARAGSAACLRAVAMPHPYSYANFAFSITNSFDMSSSRALFDPYGIDRVCVPTGQIAIRSSRDFRGRIASAHAIAIGEMGRKAVALSLAAALAGAGLMPGAIAFAEGAGANFTEEALESASAQCELIQDSETCPLGVAGDPVGTDMVGSQANQGDCPSGVASDPTMSVPEGSGATPPCLSPMGPELVTLAADPAAIKNPVATEAELQAKVNAYEGVAGDITLTANINLTKPLELPEGRPFTINLNGFTLKGAANKTVFLIGGGNEAILTIKNVVNGTTTAQTTGLLDATLSTAVAAPKSLTSIIVKETYCTVKAKTLFTTKTNFTWIVDSYGKLDLTQVVEIGANATVQGNNTMPEIHSSAAPFAFVLNGQGTSKAELRVHGKLNTDNSAIKICNTDDQVVFESGSTTTVEKGDIVTCAASGIQYFEPRGKLIAKDGKVLKLDSHITPSLNFVLDTTSWTVPQVSDATILPYLAGSNDDKLVLVYNKDKIPPYLIETIKSIKNKTSEYPNGTFGMVGGVLCANAASFDTYVAANPTAEVVADEVPVNFYKEDGVTLIKQVKVYKGHKPGEAKANKTGVDTTPPTDLFMQALAAQDGATFAGWKGTNASGQVTTFANAAALMGATAAPALTELNYTAVFRDDHARYNINFKYGTKGAFSKPSATVRDDRAVPFPEAAEVPATEDADAANWRLIGWFTGAPTGTGIYTYTTPAAGEAPGKYAGGTGTKVACADGTKAAADGSSTGTPFIPTANATYYARYQFAGQYDVTFTYKLPAGAPSGTPVPNAHVAKVSSGFLIGDANVPVAPDLPHMNFVGWKAADAAGNPTGNVLSRAEIAAQTVTGAKNFVAVYELANYTVNFTYKLTGTDGKDPSKNPTMPSATQKTLPYGATIGANNVATPPTLPHVSAPKWYVADAAGNPTGAPLTSGQVAAQVVGGPVTYVCIYERIAEAKVRFSWGLAGDEIARITGVPAAGVAGVAGAAGSWSAGVAGKQVSQPQTLDVGTGTTFPSAANVALASADWVALGWYTTPSAEGWSWAGDMSGVKVAEPNGTLVAGGAGGAGDAGGDAGGGAGGNPAASVSADAIYYMRYKYVGNFAVKFSYKLNVAPTNDPAKNPAMPAVSSVAVKAGNAISEAKVPVAGGKAHAIFRGWFAADASGNPVGDVLSAAQIGARTAASPMAFVAVYDRIAEYDVTLHWGIDGEATSSSSLGAGASGVQIIAPKKYELNERAVFPTRGEVELAAGSNWRATGWFTAPGQGGVKVAEVDGALSAGAAALAAATVTSNTNFYMQYEYSAPRQPLTATFRWGDVFIDEIDGADKTMSSMVVDLMTGDTFAKAQSSQALSEGLRLRPIDVPGYIFVGWMDESGHIVDASSPILHDVVYTAKYTKRPAVTPPIGDGVVSEVPGGGQGPYAGGSPNGDGVVSEANNNAGASRKPLRGAGLLGNRGAGAFGALGFGAQAGAGTLDEAAAAAAAAAELAAKAEAAAQAERDKEFSLEDLMNKDAEEKNRKAAAEAAAAAAAAAEGDGGLLGALGGAAVPVAAAAGGAAVIAGAAVAATKFGAVGAVKAAIGIGASPPKP